MEKLKNYLLVAFVVVVAILMVGILGYLEYLIISLGGFEGMCFVYGFDIIMFCALGYIIYDARKKW